jgi:LPXTG-site transpeptidase (sortase) family protein
MSRLRRRDWLAAAVSGGLVAAVAVLVVVAVQSGELAQGKVTSTDAVAPPVPAVAVAAQETAVGGAQTIPAMAAVTATSIEIPAIGLRSSLARLRLDAGGVLQPPANPAQAGWFSAGPVPGDRGPAVIAGHLDSRTGPAVFVRLGQVKVGDIVVVRRSDGTSVRFRVQSTHRYAKAAFPTAAVYGPTPTATLRLITCGGAYDHTRKRYPDDVVVIAEVI